MPKWLKLSFWQCFCIIKYDVMKLKPLRHIKRFLRNKNTTDMDQDNKYNENAPDEQLNQELNDNTEATEADAKAEVESPAEDDLQAQLDEAKAALEKEKKEYLFLMADFDNYRKRVIKEKADILRNGAEKVLGGILPIVDDFERGLQAAMNAENSGAIAEGMELIYNKLLKFLEDNGVKAMQSTGEAFDSELHEAIAMIPAPSEDLKGKVIDTTQKGYMINDKVLRHAKVAVGE
jgi:molecular chaperone GrpE